MSFNQITSKIMEFYEQKGVDFGGVLPKIQLDYTEVDRFDPFIMTGKYQYMNDTITLYVNGRHLKDILRTFCHELVHAWQYRRDPELYEEIDKSGTLEENSQLLQLEQEAYTVGNLLFREWTENYKQNNLNEQGFD